MTINGTETPRISIIDGLNCAKLDRAQFERTLAGGIAAFNLTATRPDTTVDGSLDSLAELFRIVEAESDIVTIVRSVAEIEQAESDGKLGIIIGTQDSSFLDREPQLLRVYEAIGMRIFQPVYNSANRFGCGALVNPDTGLTDVGREWVDLMNELGLVIDLSHCGRETAHDVLAASSQPVIFSHSNSSVLAKSPRNIPDDLATAAAKTGGTVGVTMWPPLLKIADRPGLDDFCKHIEHYLNLVGEDHVAFGGDLSEGTKTLEDWLALYGPEPIWPEVTGILGPWYTYENRATPGFETMADAQNLVHALARRGHAQRVIEKVMRGNLLRVYKEVWGE
ncbi:dipeptidase [Oceanibium sediminis]|uniref:dipeptidase n=1 Tax=Oceanibium sediminis TaxID=2026339 RepID=UPI000DD37C0D|nr:membrane dipeptidase [Oceanibium sediminis]